MNPEAFSMKNLKNTRDTSQSMFFYASKISEVDQYRFLQHNQK